MPGKPSWKRTGDEFAFVWDEWGIAATVDVLEEERASLQAEITFYSTAGGGHLLMRHANLMSSQARTALIRECRARDQTVEWADVLEQLCTITVREWRTAPPALDLADTEIPDRPLFLDSVGLIAEGALTILFGPGKTSKSLIALALANAAAHGGSVAQVAFRDPIPVLYLDWETNHEIMAARLRAIRAAADFGAGQPVRYRFMSKGLASPGNVSVVRKDVAQHGIRLLVADSYMFAAAPEPETSDAVSRLHRAIRSLGPGLSTLMISHLAKSELDKSHDQRSPIGSIMAKNVARGLWQVRRADDEERVGVTRTMHLTLTQVDENLGPARQPKFGMDVSITSEVGYHPSAIAFREGTVRDVPESKVAQLKDILLSEGAKTVPELVEWTGWTRGAVKSALRRIPGCRPIDNGDRRGGRGKSIKWGMTADRAE